MRKIILAICAAALLGGCTEPEIPTPPVPPTPTENGDETVVTFTFGVDNPVAATRAVNETAITNLQLLLIGSDGTRYFYEPGNKTSVTAQIKRGVYTVYACTHSVLKIKDYDESLINYFFTPIYTEADTSLPMTFKGTADFSVGKSNSYTVKLVRTVAKLRFNVTTASNVTITKMSLQNAPKQTKLFPQANPGYNFSERAIGATSGAFTLYMPEHLAGTVSSITDQKQRTAANAPANATYLKIEGVVTRDKGYNVTEEKGFESIVYLGSNTTGDFNVRRNYDYRININIASNLSTDTRVELYRVGHDCDARWTPDGKYIMFNSYTIKFVPFFLEGEKGYGAETVKYQYVFEGNALNKLKVDGKYLTGNTVSGTLTSGRVFSHLLYYDVALFNPNNSVIKYTLTFTDEYGGTTIYPGEFRYANAIHVGIYPKGSSVKKADLSFTSGASVIECAPTETYDYLVRHSATSIQMTIKPRSGYTFKGWYKTYECLDKDFISSSTTLTHTPDYNFTHAYAKVE